MTHAAIANVNAVWGFHQPSVLNFRTKGETYLDPSHTSFPTYKTPSATRYSPRSFAAATHPADPTNLPRGPDGTETNGATDGSTHPDSLSGVQTLSERRQRPLLRSSYGG